MSRTLTHDSYGKNGDLRPQYTPARLALRVWSRPPDGAAPSCWLASPRSRTGIPRWDLGAVSSQPYIHIYIHTGIQPYICLSGKDPRPDCGDGGTRIRIATARRVPATDGGTRSARDASSTTRLGGRQLTVRTPYPSHLVPSTAPPGRTGPGGSSTCLPRRAPPDTYAPTPY